MEAGGRRKDSKLLIHTLTLARDSDVYPQPKYFSSLKHGDKGDQGHSSRQCDYSYAIRVPTDVQNGG